MNNKPLYIIIITLLILYGFEKFKKPTILKESEKHYYYETDSVFKNKYFELQKAFNKKTPPLIVTKWLKPEKGKNNIIEKIPDSIIIYITDLEKRLSISDGYLKNYPDANKLISFDLKLDSLSITTLDIKSNIFTNKYPLYLKEFNYKWVDNSLSHKKYKYKNGKKTSFKELYFNIGNDLINDQQFVSLEHNLKLGRIKFNTEFIGNLKKTNQSEFKVKIGYRLFK